LPFVQLFLSAPCKILESVIVVLHLFFLAFLALFFSASSFSLRRA